LLRGPAFRRARIAQDEPKIHHGPTVALPPSVGKAGHSYGPRACLF
jgi:hypothetical protein